MCALGVSQVSAAQQPTVNVQNSWPVDIFMTVNSTAMQVEASKLRQALISSGVAETRIKIIAPETKSYSSTGNGIQEMATTWKKFPNRAANPIIVGGQLRGPYGPASAADTSAVSIAYGLYDKSDPETNQFASSAIKFAWYCHAHPLGVSSRMHARPDGNYDILFAGIETVDTTRTKCYMALYYLENINLAAGYPYLEWSGFKTMAPNPAYKVTELARGPVVEVRANGHPTNSFEIKMVSERNTHKVYFNGISHITHTTTHVPEGSMGYIGSYLYHTGISNAALSIFKSTPLVDIVRAPEYTPDSAKFIIDITDTPRLDFSNNIQSAELTQRLIEDEVYYIGWGTLESQASIQSFIQHNDGRGKYFPNTAADIYTQTAKYIEPIVNARFDGDTAYLLQGKNYSFETTT